MNNKKERKCDHCDGRGAKWGSGCKVCKGRGVVPRNPMPQPKGR